MFKSHHTNKKLKSKHRLAAKALPTWENPRRVRAIRATWAFGLDIFLVTPPFEQEGQPTRESHLSDSRKVGSRHCQRPSGRLTLPVEDGARVHRRFLGGILT
ncbi:unnamed protein product [Clavelina lepadiformis]|uniref:Uncharacterized protein n=1 Tax=Clavelina lepadiformis TaxID=159417 RepID=A0ABP0F6T5_CLALP